MEAAAALVGLALGLALAAGVQVAGAEVVLGEAVAVAGLVGQGVQAAVGG